MAYEKKTPNWGAAGIEPPESKQQTGWEVEDRPPAAWLNWYMNGTGESIKELQDKAAEKEWVQEQLDALDPELPDASTTQKGIVQLSSAIDGSRENVAATEKAVKDAYDRGSAGVTAAETAQAKADEAETPAGAQAKADEAATGVQDHLNAHLADLASNAVGKGASTIGVYDVDGLFTATNVEGALHEAMQAANSAFQSGNEKKQALVDALIAAGISASTTDSWDTLLAKMNNIVPIGKQIPIEAYPYYTALPSVRSDMAKSNGGYAADIGEDNYGYVIAYVSSNSTYPYQLFKVDQPTGSTVWSAYETGISYQSCLSVNSTAGLVAVSISGSNNYYINLYRCSDGVKIRSISIPASVTIFGATSKLKVSDSGNIYFVSDGNAICMNQNGSILWQKAVYAAGAIEVDPRTGDCYVFMGSSSARILEKLDVNGNLKWTFNCQNSSDTSSLSLNVNGKKVIYIGIYSNLNPIKGIDCETGILVESLNSGIYAMTVGGFASDASGALYIFQHDNASTINIKYEKISKNRNRTLLTTTIYSVSGFYSWALNKFVDVPPYAFVNGGLRLTFKNSDALFNY